MFAELPFPWKQRSPQNAAALSLNARITRSFDWSTMHMNLSIFKKVIFFTCIYCTNIFGCWVQTEYYIWLTDQSLERGEAELEDGPFHPSQSTDAINSISLLSIFLEGVLRNQAMERASFLIGMNFIFYKGIIIFL